MTIRLSTSDRLEKVESDTPVFPMISDDRPEGPVSGP